MYVLSTISESQNLVCKREKDWSPMSFSPLIKIHAVGIWMGNNL